MNATFTKNDGTYVLALERDLAHPPEKVWRALTEHGLLAQWFPASVEGEWRVGAPLTFTFPDDRGVPDADMVGEVLAVDPNRLLAFRWGRSTIRCALTPSERGCRFQFSQTVEDARLGAQNAAGWELCLDGLQMLIEGAGIAKFVYEVWNAKFKHYVAAFTAEHGEQSTPPRDLLVAMDEGRSLDA